VGGAVADGVDRGVVPAAEPEAVGQAQAPVGAVRGSKEVVADLGGFLDADPLAARGGDLVTADGVGLAGTSAGPSRP
jgi:hypothetical protein